MKKLLLILLLCTCALGQGQAGVKPPLGTLLDYSNPLTKGLVGFWPFTDKPGLLGTTYDLSGNGNHGALVGHTYSVPGRNGPALEFDGNEDYVDVGNFNNGAELSVFAWVNILADDSWIVNKRGAAPDDQWQLYHFLNEQSAKIFDGTSEVGTVSTSSIINTGWRHVGFVTNGVNGGYVKLYIDGSEVDSDTLSGNMKLGARELLIGTRGWDKDSGEFNGTIDEVMIYSRALSAAEVLSLYCDGSQMFRQPRYPIAVAAGGQVIMIITSSLPIFLVFGMVGAFVYSGRKAA